MTIRENQIFFQSQSNLIIIKNQCCIFYFKQILLTYIYEDRVHKYNERMKGYCSIHSKCTLLHLSNIK